MIAEVLDSGSEKVGGKNPFATVTGGCYQYPLSLDDVDPVTGRHVHSSSLMFHITEAMPSGSNLTGKSLKARQDGFLQAPGAMATIGMIQTYVPAMNEDFRHDYSTSDTSIFNDLMSGVAAGMNHGGSVGEKIAVGGKKALEGASDRIIQSEMSNKAVVMETGKIPRQRQSYLYNGTNMRTHTFSFVMRPRSKAELRQVGQIIYMFRKYSSGTRSQFDWSQQKIEETTGHKMDSFGVVSAPPVWFVEEVIHDRQFSRSIDKFMFGPATVTGVRVNKTPEQIYQTIANTGGDPVEIELEVTMQELIPVYSDFWDRIREMSFKE